MRQRRTATFFAWLRQYFGRTSGDSNRKYNGPHRRKADSFAAVTAGENSLWHLSAVNSCSCGAKGVGTRFAASVIPGFVLTLGHAISL